MHYEVLIEFPLFFSFSRCISVSLTNGRFVQSLALVEEMRHILRIVTQQSVLYEILNAYKEIKYKEYKELVRILSS